MRTEKGQSDTLWNGKHLLNFRFHKHFWEYNFFIANKLQPKKLL